MMLIGHLCIIFGEMSIQDFGPFLKSGYLFFVVELWDSLYIFSHSVGYLFTLLIMPFETLKLLSLM